MQITMKPGFTSSRRQLGGRHSIGGIVSVPKWRRKNSILNLSLVLRRSRMTEGKR